jgi:ADP-dependent NAD(P)H-hydrate dehydratase
MTTWREVDAARLRGWPLPVPEADGDKESRGRVLVVAGSREMPGAALLAAEAALRAGAGKLVIATAASVAPAVAVAMPEARVIALPESARGGMRVEGIAQLEPLGSDTAGVLVGPGMVDAECTLQLVRALLPLFTRATVVLDALAMDVVRGAVPRFDQPVVLTPHAGEMAHLIEGDKDAVLDDAAALASRQSGRWNVVLALKGATTCVAAPSGDGWRHVACTPGLGTSGSGDVLAGLVAGLAARGASPEQAAVWGVALHAAAGDALARRIGHVGFLARELAGEVPALMEAWASEAR